MDQSKSYAAGQTLVAKLFATKARIQSNKLFKAPVASAKAFCAGARDAWKKGA